VSATLDALQTSATTNTLASPRIRARNKEKAKILIGSRVPVITSSTDAICYCDWGFVYVPRNIRRSMKSVTPAAD
jgi:Flp pilus assembly secretin CpaC